MPHKPLLTVRLESVFARDYQRRLRLVIELLQQQSRRQLPPLEPSEARTMQTPRALSATQSNSGGHK